MALEVGKLALNQLKQSETVTQVAKFTEEQIAQMKKAYEEGNWTWRVLGFTAAIGLVILGVLNFLSHLFGLHPFYACLDLYIILGGLSLSLLEFKEKFLPASWVEAVKREALFLSR